MGTTNIFWGEHNRSGTLTKNHPLYDYVYIYIIIEQLIWKWNRMIDVGWSKIVETQHVWCDPKKEKSGGSSIGSNMLTYTHV